MPAIRAVLDGLRDSDDVVFVKVKGPGEQLKVAKSAGSIVVDVDEPGETVHVSAPVRAISSAVNQFGTVGWESLWRQSTAPDQRYSDRWWPPVAQSSPSCTSLHDTLETRWNPVEDGEPALWLSIPQRQYESMNNMNSNRKALSGEQRRRLLGVLKARFEKNMNRHQGLEWPKVQARLEANVEKLWSLSEMERTGGEPDVVGHDKKTGEYIFYDCSAESPKGRRSVCYDREALESRKEHKPENNAIDMAAAIGIELLTEERYRELQQLGNFDTKTSSWVKTPSDIRTLGGAVFCDRRYNTVFLYHNGAESYYAARGFRGSLRV